MKNNLKGQNKWLSILDQLLYWNNPSLSRCIWHWFSKDTLQWKYTHVWSKNCCIKKMVTICTFGLSLLSNFCQSPAAIRQTKRNLSVEDKLTNIRWKPIFSKQETFLEVSFILSFCNFYFPKWIGRLRESSLLTPLGPTLCVEKEGL